MDEPESLNPYQQLIRQSRKMGSAASRSYNVTKEFLRNDVSVLRPQQWIKRQASDASFDTMLEQSNEVLASAQTVILPNNLFPDTVTVDRTKVTIRQKTFFWSSNTISIRIEDMLNIALSVGPLFGSLKISVRIMNSTDHFDINYFWRKDAIFLERIIQGYMITVHNNIDTSHIPRDELVQKLLELGHNAGQR
jgi:hypothetical protein